jgi:hypothetical protein
MLNAVLKKLLLIKNVPTVEAICMTFETMCVLLVTQLLLNSKKVLNTKNTRMRRNTRKLEN